jgi:hypothetical protein
VVFKRPADSKKADSVAVQIAAAEQNIQDFSPVDKLVDALCKSKDRQGRSFEVTRGMSYIEVEFWLFREFMSDVLDRVSVQRW